MHPIDGDTRQWLATKLAINICKLTSVLAVPSLEVNLCGVSEQKDVLD